MIQAQHWRISISLLVPLTCTQDFSCWKIPGINAWLFRDAKTNKLCEWFQNTTIQTGSIQKRISVSIPSRHLLPWSLQTPPQWAETESPSCLSCTHCKGHPPPHHSLAEVSDPATQQKHCYLHSLGRKQQRCSCKGWTPIVKQGRKKSKHKERMDQTKFAFPFSQGQELGLAVHNFCYITPVHYSRNCGRTQK